MTSDFLQTLTIVFFCDGRYTNYFASDPIFVYLLLVNIFNLIISYTNATDLIDLMKLNVTSHF